MFLFFNHNNNFHLSVYTSQQYRKVFQQNFPEVDLILSFLYLSLLRHQRLLFCNNGQNIGHNKRKIQFSIRIIQRSYGIDYFTNKFFELLDNKIVSVTLI